MKKIWARRIGASFVALLTAYSMNAQELDPVANFDASPGAWLLNQDPQDPLLRVRYFPKLVVNILIENPEASTASRLKRVFGEQVVPYFKSDPRRIDRIDVLLSFWSADMSKKYWGAETFDLKALKVRFNENSLSALEEGVLHWAWMRLGLDELSRPGDKRSQIWLSSFFSNFERRYADARTLLEVDPFYALKAFEYMKEYWKTCVSEFNKGTRSARFLRLGEIFSRYRDQSFAGSTLDWKHFEDNLASYEFDKLRVDEIAFLIVLRKLEVDQRLTDGAPWGRIERERILSLAGENKVWGLLADNEDKQKIASWSKPEAEKEYREKKRAEKFQSLNPFLGNPVGSYSAVAFALGMGIRSATKPFRSLAKMRGPVPMDLLERQMAANSSGSVAHEEARLMRATQMAQRQAAVEYAEKSFKKGEAMGAFLDQQAEVRRDLIMSRIDACSFALKSSASVSQSVFGARQVALKVLEASSVSRQSKKLQTFSKFANQELGAKHWYQRWQPKFWRQRRLSNQFGSYKQKWFNKNPDLTTADRFSAMLPGENLRLSLLESSFSRLGTALAVGGFGTFGLLAGNNGADYFWGPEEPNFTAIEQGKVDLLWNQTLAERSVSADQVKELQLNSILSELADLETLWNPEDENRLAIPEPVRIKIIADARSASDPDPETGRVQSFFVWIYQEVPGSDPVTRYSNQLGGYILRFESAWDSQGSPDIRKAGKVGWKLTGIQALEGASPNTRRQAALARRSDGLDYWLDPETAEILFVGVKAVPSNRQ